MSGIKGAVYRGEWKAFGITNWNELILYAFGELKISKNKYEGKKGLEDVLKILKEFKKSILRVLIKINHFLMEIIKLI